MLNRLAASISQHNENFYGARYIFSCHLLSKWDICIFALALRHLQVQVYSFISVKFSKDNS